MEGKIDIHNTAVAYARALETLRRDNSMHPRSRELLLNFLRDCELGKTILRKRKKKIGPRRMLKYVWELGQFARWIQKPLDQVELADMETFIQGLEHDAYHKRNGQVFSSRSKLDIKCEIRKFYKWLLGDNKEYPPLVSWIDTYEELVEVPALSREEAEEMVAAAGCMRDKALIMLLFDAGARIEECLNLRHQDVTQDGQFMKLRIRWSKTKPRTITVPIAAPWLKRWIKQHPSPEDPNGQLFPYRYDSVRMMISRLGKRSLKKRVHPHLFRHSSATYYASKLNYFQMCYRYGWSFSSKMPQRYIDRAGIQDEAAAKAVESEEQVHRTDEIERLREQVALLTAQHDDLQDHNRRIAEVLAPIAKDPRKLEKLMALAREHG